MNEIPIRRGQVITPNGPGSMSVSTKGTTMIMGRLDKWYYSGESKSRYLDEFKRYEPRLEKILNVEYFMLPPDYREKGQGENINTRLTLPMLRFPQWHYCTKCKKLKKIENYSDNIEKCECGGDYVQVPFVTICSKGHIDDFPWREWVHKSLNPKCNKEMKLVSVGGTNLSTMEVKCECGEQRSLFGVTAKNNEENEVSYLARNLTEKPKEFYKCTGRKAWFGGEDTETCNEYPIAVLKNSSNIYFPETISALYLPGDMPKEVEEILELFDGHFGRKYLRTALKSANLEEQIDTLKELFEERLENYSSNQIERAIKHYNNQYANVEKSYIANIEETLREEEHKVLIDEIESKDLIVLNEWDNINNEVTGIEKFIKKINLVTKLRETRVLYGFSRLNAPQGELNALKIQKGKQMLFKDPFIKENNWLPANIVYGEGIFIELNNELLDEWEENNKEMTSRFKEFYKKYEKLVAQKIVRERKVTPRFVLIHTLAHLIINELVFECGYSATSLRERLYVNIDEDNKSNGFLIYTAAGDADGTLGGLVRMGKKENFIPILQRAINKAKWCSSDPICTDIGELSGQGVNRLNMSACHNCAYLPETSCEEFNMFLDRGVIAGTPKKPEIGFFVDESVI